MVPAVMSCAVQTSALQRVSSMSVSSTIVTGTIAKGTTDLVNYFSTLFTHCRGNLQDKNKLNLYRDSSLFYFGLWFIYFLGALIGSIAVKMVDLYCLLPIVGILGLLVLGEICKPFCDNVNKINEMNGGYEIFEGKDNSRKENSTGSVHKEMGASLSYKDGIGNQGYQPPVLIVPFEH